MPEDLTPEGRRAIEDVARRNGFSVEAIIVLLRALTAGHGSMAQFSHPELGGMGQWTRGGMIMIGDMFNQALKARVDAACAELASLLDRSILFGPLSPGVSVFETASWWPEEFGAASASGEQNDLRYAFFPRARRLVVQRDGTVAIYDTGDHMLSGVSQQQGGSQSLTFTSQHGPVRVQDLPVVSGGRRAGSGAPASSFDFAPAPLSPAETSSTAGPDPFATIEKLADLHRRGILSDEEFAAKKAELLSRL